MPAFNTIVEPRAAFAAITASRNEQSRGRQLPGAGSSNRVGEKVDAAPTAVDTPNVAPSARVATRAADTAAVRAHDLNGAMNNENIRANPRTKCPFLNCRYRTHRRPGG